MLLGRSAAETTWPTKPGISATWLFTNNVSLKQDSRRLQETTLHIRMRTGPRAAQAPLISQTILTQCFLPHVSGLVKFSETDKLTLGLDRQMHARYRTRDKANCSAFLPRLLPLPPGRTQSHFFLLQFKPHHTSSGGTRQRRQAPPGSLLPQSLRSRTGATEHRTETVRRKNGEATENTSFTQKLMWRGHL